MKCRACFSTNLSPFVDLGWQPPSNDFIHAGHKQYPLKMNVCEDCGLGQLSNDVPPEEIFNGAYAYFSSASPTWVADRKALAKRMINECRLRHDELVIDIGGNDGYYLTHFHGTCRLLNYEPSASVAKAAIEDGIETRQEFWGAETAKGIEAVLINATNVLAHTPDMDGFIQGIAGALAPNGIATLEFPLFSNLIKHNQLDTIYHEHYSYISVSALRTVLERHGLRIWRVEELDTHGGSVRIFACKLSARFREEASVARVTAGELWAPDVDFQKKAHDVKTSTLRYLAALGEQSQVIGYGAPAKATVLCNYLGLDRDFIQYTIDDSPAKQGHCIPGTNIPIVSFDYHAGQMSPEVIFVFAWNLLEPVAIKLRKQYADLYESAPTLVTAIPRLTITKL